MRLIGKRGDYTFYHRKGYLPLLDKLPTIKPDHIIAGGASVSILQGMHDHGYSLPRSIKDIDVWISGDIPAEATRESEFAWNYLPKSWAMPVQYMKIRATTPSALLNTFDIDACKCAFYNITAEGFDVCVHKYLKPLVYGKSVTGICGVNPLAYNRFSFMRFNKYARKLGIAPQDMYKTEDYSNALGYLETFSGVNQEELLNAVGGFNGDQYELLAHLQELFPTRDSTVAFDMAGWVTPNSDHRVVGTRSFTMPYGISNTNTVPIDEGEL